MAKRRANSTANVGVAEHGNSAALATVAPDGALVDRRRIDLTESPLPTHPHHHEGSWAVGRYRDSPWAREISLAEAIELVKRVTVAAAHGARESLKALAAAAPMPITTIAICECPKLPPTIEERIKDNRAQTVADTVMYRQALATAAEARGWSVHWYDRERVFADAATAICCDDINAFLLAMGKSIGAALAGQTQACGGSRDCSRWARRAMMERFWLVCCDDQLNLQSIELENFILAPSLFEKQTLKRPFSDSAHNFHRAIFAIGPFVSAAQLRISLLPRRQIQPENYLALLLRALPPQPLTPSA